jgi:competence protein ComEC
VKLLNFGGKKMLKKSTSKKLILAFSMFLMFTFTFIFTSGSPKITKALSGTLEAHIIDVGQGDSILIRLPDGKNMVIDGGPGTAATTVVNYIKGQGITLLDYVVETHPHEDHIGGLTNVINSFTIGKVYIPNATATTQCYKDLMNAIKAKNITPIQTKAGVTIFNTTYSGKVLKAVMVAPIDNSYTNVNDYSAVIRITYGTESFLFVGDASEFSEAEILAAGSTISADVLKVGHHGSATSSTAAFLKAVSPKSSVISVGLGNSYGHPTDDCINRLKAVNSDILRTDLQGSIVYSTNGTGFTVNKTPWYKGTGGTGGSGGVVINEVLPAPSVNYTNEFCELYNSSSASIDISGYTIDDIANGGGSPHVIAAGTTIPSHGYFVWETSAYFNNTGDDVRLLDKSGTEIDRYTYGSSQYDKSWIRLPDGGTWQTTMSSTPSKGAYNR